MPLLLHLKASSGVHSVLSRKWTVGLATATRVVAEEESGAGTSDFSCRCESRTLPPPLASPLRVAPVPAAAAALAAAALAAPVDLRRRFAAGRLGPATGGE